MTIQKIPFSLLGQAIQETTAGFRATRRPASFRAVILAVVCACFFVASASAQIAVDATSHYNGAATSGAVTSFTLSHTLGSGSNRLLVCGVQIASPNNMVQANILPSITFNNSTPMKVITNSNSPNQVPGNNYAYSSSIKIFTEMLYLSGTDLGTNVSGAVNISVSVPVLPASGSVATVCTSFTGVAYGAPEAIETAYNGSGGDVPAPLVTLSAGDLVVDSYAGGFTIGSTGKAISPNVSPNTNQKLLYSVIDTADGLAAGSSWETVAAAGTVTPAPEWTTSTSRTAYSVAAFAPAATTNYTVTPAVSPTGGGTIALSPSALNNSYASGTSIQVTATPAAYYTFTGFSGLSTASTSPATLTVTQTGTVTANFAQTMCTLTTTYTGQGSISPASGSYPCGSTINLTATPSGGYSFGNWSGSGYSGTSSSASFTLATNTTETATFLAANTCTLGTSVTGSGSITLNPTGGSYTCGSNVIVSATPAADWSLTGFSGALTGAINPQTLTLTTSTTVAAAFTQTSFPVNVTIVGPGTVATSATASANSDGTYPAGTQVTLTASPSAGAIFTGYTGSLVSATSPATVTVSSTENITATFAYPSITRDAVSHAATTGSSSVLTWTHTLGTGSSRMVVIEVGSADTALASPAANAVVTSVLFNGVYATAIPNSLEYGGTTGMVQSQLFYLTDAELPAAGTYTVQVNLTGSVGGIQAGAISLFGVNQGPPEAVAINKATTGVNLISSSITTLSNNAWVVDMLEDGDVATLTADAGQTLAWSQSSTGVGTGGSSTEAVATPAAVTLGWSGNANRLVESLASFAPAGTSLPSTYALTSSVVGGGTVSTNPGLTLYPAQTGVRFTVADTGTGMEPEVTARVFEAFFTTKELTGTGLGLWVSQEIIVKHGGLVHVRSRAAQAGKPSGTVFQIFLPDDPELTATAKQVVAATA